MPRFLLVVSIATALTACASAAKSSSQPCELAPADTVYLKHGTVYRECAVDRRAKVIDRSALPQFSPDVSLSRREACYSAEVEFVVDKTGVPAMEDAQVLRTNEPTFGQAAVAAIARWRYEPAMLKGVPVRQIVKEKVGRAATMVAVRAGSSPPARRQPAPTC